MAMNATPALRPTPTEHEFCCECAFQRRLALGGCTRSAGLVRRRLFRRAPKINRLAAAWERRHVQTTAAAPAALATSLVSVLQPASLRDSSLRGLAIRWRPKRRSGPGLLQADVQFSHQGWATGVAVANRRPNATRPSVPETDEKGA